MAITESYAISDLIRDSPRFAGLRGKLLEFEPGSDEYLYALFDELPLNSYPTYKTFLKQQAVEVDNFDKSDHLSPVFRSSLSPKQLVTCVDSTLQSGFDHFMLSVKRWPSNDFLGVRPYDAVTDTWADHFEFQSYQEVARRSRAFGSGILSVVNTKRRQTLTNNDFIVAVLSHNTPQWVITDLACQSFSLPNTSLYETLGPQTSEYIMNLTESPVLVYSKNNLYNVLNFLPKLEFVNTLICMDYMDDSQVRYLNESLLNIKVNARGEQITFYSMEQVEKIGVMTNISLIPPRADSLYTISFTSGTTGLPKGVEITHQILTSGVAFGLSTFKIPSNKKDKQLYDLCFLPLAHIFQRMIVAYDISRGVGLGFLNKPDPTLLVENLKLLKPDSLALVPRILTRFEAGIKNNLSQSTLRNGVANNIIDAKAARFSTKGGTDHSIMNYLVYHRVLIQKIREGLGLSNTTYLVTGSAPISKETLLFLRSSLDTGVRQGYGLTESFAGICLSEPFERDAGSCGAIGITAECRLRDVPELNYYAKRDLKGELLLRGPQIFSKYYKNEEETAKAVDEHNWFATGDVGFIDPKGRLHIIDRVKNFFKLAHGEYIAPEKIENLYLSVCPYITQIFVYGDTLQNYLVGVLSIDVDSVRDFLGNSNPQIKSWEVETLVNKLNKDVTLRKSLLNSVNSCMEGLQGFEKLHNIYIGVDLLSVENGTVTPTLKIKRVQATAHFKRELERMYEEGSIIKTSKL
ncbi:medium-chain fatty acid-CoA ligase FAA2 KNAG_0L00990 [Huiozyma naganishii CBS 8797]|uniref:AMP-dependent synthetase/ligase domain-containing protein n=1 Tax=Huiozyma naganishii (strain ATCC MYA-139 / BCRC 22969 / CBS 8797 / KCTC 17520 / NBRC 10181 / NCYC 3082 / Yp74L-3) TaxID=1071383 RepID=J7SB41_HUIN7|nr:hypothetical protein KNAG_0L00990 [Kazachstania naganishii CBS 8797]CCK72721.1 hypothetical protein KNAG_0L00990 [Kazachstania naganishii CBS 8797]